MIIVEQGHQAGTQDRTLAGMFEDRKSVFVDLLKWDLPVLDDRFEIDGFDNEDPTYILIASDDGDHLGSARLLPTTKPHILSLFPELCAASAPAGPDCFEITRFCLSRRQNAQSRLRTRNRLVSALAGYALEAGIRTYTGVAEMAWLQQVLAFGWACRPLGPPVQHPCGILGALAIDIRSDTPTRLAENGIWEPVPEFAGRIREAA